MSGPGLPDLPVRWGVLGAGQVARLGVVPALARAAGAEVVAVASRDPARASAMAPGARIHRTYAELIDDDDVEVVYIALPNDAHLPWARAALGAGRHVLCEKPLGLSAGDVEAAFAGAVRAGRLLVEASWYRWHPRTRRAEEIVASGVLGEIRAVDAGFTFSGVPATDYRMDPAMGGGALYDVGCYALSAAGWATGWAPLGVVGAERRESPGGVDMATEAELRHEAVTVTIRAAFDRPEQQWLEVSGHLATLRFSAPAFTAWTDDRTALELAPAGGAPTREHFAPCDPYQLMVEAVGRRVRGGDAWVVPPEQSVAVARMLDAVRAAPTSGG